MAKLKQEEYVCSYLHMQLADIRKISLFVCRKNRQVKKFTTIFMHTSDKCDVDEK